jgi:hypothetical protein
VCRREREQERAPRRWVPIVAIAVVAIAGLLIAWWMWPRAHDEETTSPAITAVWREVGRGGDSFDFRSDGTLLITESETGAPRWRWRTSGARTLEIEPVSIEGSSATPDVDRAELRLAFESRDRVTITSSTGVTATFVRDR